MAHHSGTTTQHVDTRTLPCSHSCHTPGHVVTQHHLHSEPTWPGGAPPPTHPTHRDPGPPHVLVEVRNGCPVCSISSGAMHVRGRETTVGHHHARQVVEQRGVWKCQHCQALCLCGGPARRFTVHPGLGRRRVNASLPVRLATPWVTQPRSVIGGLEGSHKDRQGHNAHNLPLPVPVHSLRPIDHNTLPPRPPLGAGAAGPGQRSTPGV